MRILNISGLIRNDFISKKKSENTIIFDLDKRFQESDFDVEFLNVYVHPYSNLFFALISRKWKEYYLLSKLKSFNSDGHKIYTFPILILPFKSKLNKFLFRLSICLNLKRLKNVMGEFTPDIIQAFDVDKSASVAMYLSRKYNLPFLVYTREVNYTLFEYIRSNLRRSSAIISHGYLHKHIVEKEFDDVKSLLIPHGVPSNLFNNPLNKSDIDKNNIKIVSIGRLINGKNFDLLIDSISDVKCFSLDIYGSGPDENYLINKVRNLEIQDRVRIITKPYTYDELPEILSRYDLFALISYPETFGRVYAEAVVCGLPVICAVGSGIYGQLEERKEAFFVHHRDSNQLKNILLQIAGDPNILSIMSNNVLNIRDKFRWDVILNSYMDVYRNVLKDKI